MFTSILRKFCWNRRKPYPTFLSFVVSTILVVFVLFYFDLIPDALNPNLLLEPLEVGQESTQSGKCIIPQLDPLRLEMMNLFKKLPKLECKGRRFGSVVGKELHIQTDGIIKEGHMFYIRRPHQDDFNFQLSPAISIDFQKKGKDGKLVLQPTEDFVQLVFKMKDGSISKELHALVIPKPNLETKTSTSTGLGLNIAFILLDSVSFGSFHRAMPESLKVLRSLPTSLIFKGQSIVGDGTTAQLCAMFTGINEQNLPEARRGFNGAETVDKWPWIFKDFQKAGYVSMYSEDMPRFASFTYRLKGFKDPPADHYTRPFFLAAEKQKIEYCVGAKATHSYSLDYTMNFFDSYPSHKKFSTTIIADLPHNRLHEVQLMDQDLALFLADFVKKGHLKNTMLVLFGDHGPRISIARSSLNGKLEERLPFLSVIMPESFNKEHKEFFMAMKNNTNLLTSYFDMHATLQHILKHPKIPKVAIGQSLFTDIDPETRNCMSAGVADHWCPCLGYRNVSVDNPDIRQLAQKAVSHLNSIISSVSSARTLCAQLELHQITRAGEVAHNQKMVKFARTKSNSRCGSCLLALNKGKVDLPHMYEIVFTVNPSGGMYEVTITVDKGNVFVDPNISRINLYGNQPQCLANDFPHLRKYCFCVK